MEKKVIALIVAAGESRRFGSELPKQYQMLEGKSLLRRSIEAFLRHPEITGVMAAINPTHLDYYQQHTEGLTLLPHTDGGATRQESVAKGLAVLTANAPDYVLIHDAARPNVTAELISRVIAGLKEVPAAIPALPVFDTLKHVEEEQIIGTIERSKVFRAQTPQGFHFKEILEAHEKCADLALTDDSAVAENAGMLIKIVAGSEHNYKITTQEDMRDAKRLLESGYETRVGMGFDTHKITSGSHVHICGVSVDAGFALEGHSDADVGLHALVDAVLGSISEGDIGQHFPPTDPKWQGADSSMFVRHACELLAKRGGKVIHADITLICEHPKISPHREAMRARIAELLAIDVSRVSVKATTTEKMGFTGRSEGIAAQAVATIRIPEDK